VIRFLSAEQVVEMHEDLLQRHGGEEGGGDRGAAFEGAEAAVQAVKNSYYESLEELAAAYAVYIVQGHVFLDGNKRAAGAAMTTFFAANGGRLRLTVRGLVKLMFELQTRAEAGARTDELVAWVAGLLRKKS
jgi:death-on-curing family protein